MDLGIAGRGPIVAGASAARARAGAKAREGAGWAMSAPGLGRLEAAAAESGANDRSAAAEHAIDVADGQESLATTGLMRSAMDGIVARSLGRIVGQGPVIDGDLASSLF